MSQRLNAMFSADGKPFDYILDIFTHRPDVDEIAFYFSDEEPEFQHYLGYLPQYTEALYWARYCDLDDGFERPTAKENYLMHRITMGNPLQNGGTKFTLLPLVW